MDPKTTSQLTLDAAVAQASARVRTVAALAAALGLLAVGAAYLLAAVMLDHAIDGGLPLGVRRVGLGAAGASLIIASIVYVIRPAVRRISDFYSAWLVERAHPQLAHALVTALELRGRADAPAGVASGLAMRAAQAVRRVDIGAVVSDRAWRRSGLAVLGVVAAFGLYTVVAPKRVAPSFLRALGADVPAPTRTSVEIVAPSVEASVVVGTAVAFDVAVTGRQPDAAWIEFSPDEGRSWLAAQRLPLTRGADEGDGRPRWRAMKSGVDVTATMWYRARAGDARCVLRRLEVRPEPVAGAPEVTLAWPEFASGPRTTRTAGPIDALIGTRVSLRVATNVPAADGRVVFRDGQGTTARQMSVDGADRRTLRAEWVVDRDCEYEIRFNDAHGEGNPNAIRYPQRARGDRPPVLTQTAPGDRTTLRPGEALAVAAEASDDWGLAELTLVYRNRGRTGRIGLMAESQRGALSAKVEQAMSAAALGAGPGDVVEVYLEASDGHQDLRGQADPQVTRGPTCEVRIVGGGKASGGAGEGAISDGGKGSDTGRDPGQRGGSDGPATAGGPSGRDNASRDGKQGDDATARGADGAGQPGESNAKSDEKDRPQSKGAGDPASKGDAKPKEDGAKGEERGPSQDEGDAGNAKNTDGKANGANPGGEPGKSDPQDANGDKTGDSGEAGRDLDRMVKENEEVLKRLAKRMGEGGSEQGGDKRGSDGDDSGQTGKPGSEGAGEELKKKPGEKTDEKTGDKTDEKSGEKTDEKSSEGEGSSKTNPQDPTKAKTGDAAKADPGKKGKDAQSRDGSKGGNDGVKSTNGSAKRANDPGAESVGKKKDGGGDGKDSKSDGRGPASGGDQTQSGDQDKPAGKDSESGSRPAKSDTDHPGRVDEAGGQADRSRPGGPDGKATKDANSGGSDPAEAGKPSSGKEDDASGGGQPTDDAKAGDNSQSTGATSGNDGGSKSDGQPGGTRPAGGVGPIGRPGTRPGEAGGGKSDADGTFAGEGTSNGLDAPLRDKTRKLVADLDRRMKRGEIDEKELRDLGWSGAEARAFVEKFKRLDGRAARERDGGLFSGRTRDGADATRGSVVRRAAGDGVRVGGATRDDAGASKRTDALREAAPEAVPPEYRDLLDEYYRAMARSRVGGEGDGRTDAKR